MNTKEIIINLKVIESLEINQKLITKETILNIEPLSIIPEFARRWIRQDSREESIKKINSIVDKAILFISEKQNKNNLSKSIYFDCNDNITDSDYDNSDFSINILSYLFNSIKGLENLKKTYISSVKTVSEIDFIIDKIQAINKKYNKI